MLNVVLTVIVVAKITQNIYGYHITLTKMNTLVSSKFKIIFCLVYLKTAVSVIASSLLTN